MTRRTTIACACLAATAATFATLRAAPPEGAARGGALMKLRDDLAITPQQKQQLRQLVVAHRQEIADALRPIVEGRRALADAAMAEPVDEAAVRAAADKLGKSIGDAALLAARLKKDAAAILTPEQLKTLGGAMDEVSARVDDFLERLEAGGR